MATAAALCENKRLNNQCQWRDSGVELVGRSMSTYTMLRQTCNGSDEYQSWGQNEGVVVPGGGSTPYTEVYTYVPRKCLFFAIFLSLCPNKKITIFSLCAQFKYDNSLFHRRGNFSMKTFRQGVPYAYKY